MTGKILRSVILVLIVLLVGLLAALYAAGVIFA